MGGFSTAQAVIAAMVTPALLIMARALRLFFAAVIFFVVAGFVIAVDHATGDAFWWLPVGVTTVGMALLVAGSAAMLSECRLGVTQIRAEISAARRESSGGLR